MPNTPVNEYKEVRYDEYCKKCKHLGELVTEELCNECLDTPINLHSVKPVKFEEKEKR